MKIRKAALIKTSVVASFLIPCEILVPPPVAGVEMLVLFVTLLLKISASGEFGASFNSSTIHK